MASAASACAPLGLREVVSVSSVALGGSAAAISSSPSSSSLSEVMSSTVRLVCADSTSASPDSSARTQPASLSDAPSESDRSLSHRRSSSTNAGPSCSSPDEGHGTMRRLMLEERSSCCSREYVASGKSRAATPPSDSEVERSLSARSEPAAAPGDDLSCVASCRAHFSPSSLSEASSETELSEVFESIAAVTISRQSGDSCVRERPSVASDDDLDANSASSAAEARGSLFVPRCSDSSERCSDADATSASRIGWSSICV